MISIANVVDDAEKIAGELVPPGSRLAEVVGVLAQHVAQLAGGKLENLADEVLGVKPAPAAAESHTVATGETASGTTAGAADPALAELQAENAKLRAQLEQVAKDAGGGQ